MVMYKRFVFNYVVWIVVVKCVEVLFSKVSLD